MVTDEKVVPQLTISSTGCVDVLAVEMCEFFYCAASCSGNPNPNPNPNPTLTTCQHSLSSVRHQKPLEGDNWAWAAGVALQPPIDLV